MARKRIVKVEDKGTVNNIQTKRGKKNIKSYFIQPKNNIKKKNNLKAFKKEELMDTVNAMIERRIQQEEEENFIISLNLQTKFNALYDISIPIDATRYNDIEEDLIYGQIDEYLQTKLQDNPNLNDVYAFNLDFIY